MTAERIVVATPHPRYDALERSLRETHGLDVLRIRDTGSLAEPTLAAFAPSHVFFPHWSSKIPAAIHERFECVVFHMTDLPFGRGGSPLQNLVARGIESTQLSALRCVAEMDAGPIYLKRPLATLGTAEEVFLRAAALMEPMIVSIVRDRVAPLAQAGDVVAFRRRTPADGNLAGATSLGQVHDTIRMLDGDGYPRAFVEVGGLRFEFEHASLKPGHVLADVRITLASERGDPS